MRGVSCPPASGADQAKLARSANASWLAKHVFQKLLQFGLFFSPGAQTLKEYIASREGKGGTPAGLSPLLFFP